MSMSRVPGSRSFPIVYRWKHGVRDVSRIFHRWSMGAESGARIADGIVDGFYKSQATSALATVTDGLGVIRDGVQEIFKDSFVTADIGDRGGGGALVGVARRVARKVRRRIAQIGGDNAIMLENYGALRSSDFEAARVAGVGRCCSEKCADGAAGDFASCDGRALGFDFVEDGRGACLYPRDITE